MENKNTEQEKQKKPIGLIFIAVVTFVLFGVLSIVNAWMPQTFQDVVVEVEEIISEADVDFDSLAFAKIAIIFQTLLGIFHIVVGAAIFFKKEWARRSLLYFSFAIVVMVLFAVLTNPGLMGSVGIEIIYRGAVIFYFTNKKVKNLFHLQTKEA